MIDDDFYNRQRYVLGEQAMQMVTSSAVFLCGLSGGVGVEVAKNVALAGVHVLTLHDLDPAAAFDAKDLCTNFYASGHSEGRLQSCVSEVAKLNPYVTVNTLSDPNEVSLKDLSFLKHYTCVVLVNEKEDLIERVDNFCHDNKICFISVNVRGVFSRTFVDFGDSFVVADRDGEECKEVRVESATWDGKRLMCKCFSGQRHDLEEGDFVRFRSCPGSVYKVSVHSPFEFSVDCEATLSVPPGDTATQVKVPQTLHFTRYSEAKRGAPVFVECDESKTASVPLLHAAFQLADQFEPRPWNESDRTEFTSRLAALCGEDACCSQKGVVDAFAHTCASEFQPLSAFVGGVVGQEVIKAVSGKFTPVQQWLYSDMREVVPAETGGEPRGFPLDPLACCVGWNAVEKIQNAKIFMVGAGAIGCELLKNFALNGFATGESGVLTVTDPDLIEKSNLNRQFLFRSEDIRKPKSVTAAEVALKMSPGMHIDAKTDKVCQETEGIFNDGFFESLDVAVNALDNVAARRYMDSRCVGALRPLLESGTLGTKGHVQVIVPFLTENYDSQQDPPEKDTPFCTIHSFPTSVDHCIQWARDLFEEYFVGLPNKVLEAAKSCGSDGGGEDGSGDVEMGDSAESADMAKKIEVVKKLKSFDDCTEFSRSVFKQLFCENIEKLLKEHPDDTEEGKLFWAPPKYKPHIVMFDPKDPAHDAFVKSFATILSVSLGLAAVTSDESSTKMSKPEISPAIFEKDNDANRHIDFIWAAASVRAENYGIDPAPRLEVKRIAGKIIPAIATTTAAVSGLVTCEVIKVLQKPVVSDSLRNAFMNLGISLFSFSQPAPPLRVRVTDTLYETVWDSWSYRDTYSGPKLSDFIAFFEKKLGFTLVALSQGAKIIYNKAVPFHRTRPAKALASLVSRGNDGGASYAVLSAGFLDTSGSPVQTPPIKYFF